LHFLLLIKNHIKICFYISLSKDRKTHLLLILSGKKISLPVARCRIDPESDRFYAVDIDRQEQVRSIYCTSTVETTTAVEDSLPVEMWATVEKSPPVEALGVEGISRPRSVRPPVFFTPSVQPLVPTPPQPSTSQPTIPKRETHSYKIDRADRTPVVETSATVEDSPPLEVESLGTQAISRPKTVEPPVSSTPSVQPPVPTSRQPSTSQPTTPKRETYSYDYEKDPDLYQLNERDHHKFKLYEERLIASKSRRKAGDVSRLARE
jgi:stress response protein YsnF